MSVGYLPHFKIYNMTWIIQNWIEIIGTLAGFIYIFLEIKQNVWLWFVGIITSALYVVVFFEAKLYADMSLNIYYVIISIYGWYWWLYGNKQTEKKELPISKLSLQLSLVLLPITIIIFGIMWFVLSRFTDSQVPMWDSLVTALSIVATWMLTRKILEQWLVWIFVNIISMGLFIYKGLYPTTLLFFVYFALALVGYYEWLKIMKQSNIETLK